MNFRPYGQIRPYGLAICFLIFGLLVFNYSAFRIRPNVPTSQIPLVKQNTITEKWAAITKIKTDYLKGMVAVKKIVYKVTSIFDTM